MKKQETRNKKQNGFTLVEMMVVIAIIGILATIGVATIGKSQAAARDVGRQQIMNSLRQVLERYYFDNQAYPSSNFCTLITTLKTGNYISADPVDPLTKVSVCGSPAPPATYAYEVPNGTNCTGSFGAAYQLRLVKEAGGTFYFCSPQ